MRTILVIMSLAWLALCSIADASYQSPALRIVVIEGEDAVNIIQQKTATAPVVEVRDRNDLPVAGAIVTFTVDGGGPAAFGGVGQSVTVTTNAAGRATTASLTPLTRGTVQIQVTAAFEGQTASAVISQTNVMTAAEASSASRTTAASNAASTAVSISGSPATLLQVVAGIGGAAAGAAILSRVEPVAPEANRSARIAAFALQNPVPFAGVTVPPGGNCGGRSDTWLYEFRFEEFAGVAATLTASVFTIDGRVFESAPTNVSIPANGTATTGRGACANQALSHTVQYTFTGTDANGHSVTVETPHLTLLPRTGTLSVLEVSAAQNAVPGELRRPQ